MVRIGLLGGVSATDDSGTALDIGPAKCQTVLAVLALSAGAAIPVNRLVDLVWGVDPPRTADKTLQTYVVRLRKALGPGSIVRSGAAYRLDVEDGAVDVGRFRRQLADGRIEAALTEWTGTPLAGLPADGLTPMVDGLVEQWLGAVEIDLERRLETDPSGAVGALTELTADHPFREGLWSLLMTALYRVGRQADALTAFQHIRRNLVDQLGVEPGPRLRDLEARILDQDEHLRGQHVSTDTFGSRRPTGTVTFGFCSVADSSRLWATHRTKMGAAMDRLNQLTRGAAERGGGYLFAANGGTFGAAFQRADDAAAWAVQLQVEVSREPWPGGMELHLRIGLHTGETEETANSYFGSAVNSATGIAGAAHGGQILVSELTSAVLERSDLREVGIFCPPGESAAHRIFQLGAGEHPALRWGISRRGNLPLRVSRLIGRDEDLDVVADALARHPVVTLLGPGGIGKTRLAIAAAQRLDTDRAPAAWFVELAGIASSSDVARTVADTLGVTDSPGRSVTQSVVAMLHFSSVLVVLDNCEHVIAGAAAIADAIVEGCPHVTVLVTSREALGIEGEHLIVVQPLTARSAAELFTERARAAAASIDPVADRTDIEEICRRVDGIPLAIELAAARAITLTPADLVARLVNRLQLLISHRRFATERHRTLRATIQWSYELLTAPQQDMFGRLSIFAGPFDLAGATAIGNPEGIGVADSEQLLADLVERSMVVVESGPFGRRFHLLDTMREFAAGQLERDGTVEETATRHSRWCLDRVASIHQLLRGPGEVDGVERLAHLWPDLRAAFARACRAVDHDRAAALIRPLVAELNLRQQTEIGDWAERILAITPPDDEAEIVFWLLCATHRYKQSADHDGYERLIKRFGIPDNPVVRYTRAYLYDSEALQETATEAVSWLREHGEDHVAAHEELGGVASALMSTGQLAELDRFVSRLATGFRSNGPPTLHYVALTLLGYSAFVQGDNDRAELLFDEAAHVDVPERTLSVNKPIEARAAFRRGHRTRALEILHGHIADLLEKDHPDFAANAAIEFVNMVAALDRPEDAEPILRYLETTGAFGALAVRTLVAEAAQRISADDLHHRRERQREPLDARRALTYMLRVLDRLIGTV